jgi:VanZ family protein
MKPNHPAFRIFLLFYLPLLIWMGVIYTFSSQAYEKQDIKPWLKKEVSEQKVKQYFSTTQFQYGNETVSIKKIGVTGFVEFFIRKGAHVIEYSILGVLSYCLFLRVVRVRPYWKYLVAVLFCSLYAISDEYHQRFVHHRTPTLVDVGLDTLAAAIGAFLFFFIVWFVRSIRKPRLYKT